MSYKKTNKLSQLCISLILVVFSLSISANDNPQQIVSVQGSPVGIVGHSVQIDIGYNTSNSDTTTTGLGFRIHYNSDLIDISNIIYVLDKDLVVDITGPLEDTENHDNDSDTDQYYSVGWASLFGDWPNDELPAKLLSLQVEVNQTIDIQQSNSAPINFSSTALAAGYEFLAENYDLELIASTWDFDGSCHADALTDGLILLRYGFDLHGENLISGVMHPDSTMSAAEVEAKIVNATSIIDIDMDGEFGALTDGLLLLRYLFDLSGQNLIDGVISTTATRTSIEEITQHLERHMPHCLDTVDSLPPIISSGATAVAIDENSGAGQVIYTATSTDLGDDVADTPIAYSLAEGSDAALSIDASTGAVTLATDPDHETQSQYSFAVIATDAAGNASEAQSVTLDINDLDDAAPTVTSGATAVAIDENSGAGQVIYTVTADDSADVADTPIAYSLAEGSDAALTIDSATGAVTLATNPDYETQSQYSFAVVATDAAGNVSQTQSVTLEINDLDENTDTPPAYGRQGPLDMTGAYGNGAISGDDGEFFKNDTSLGFDYSGFANLVTELYPFEFGTGGTLEFTASVPTGESVDVSFQLQKQGSDAGLLCEYGPVWDSGATTVSSANAQTFTIDIPAQGGDTFSNMIMELSADDINVKITDVYVTTSEKTDAEQTVPAECDGSLDMTGAYGNGAVLGEGTADAGKLFMNDTSLGLEFSGFANTTTDVYPFEFGSGGTLEFTASVPAGQSTTSVDVNFQFHKQASSSGKFCDIAPIWEASNTVSGPEDETFTVAIPSQGGNTFSNLIMELSEDDVIVKITGVKVTPSAKTADAPTVPEICEGSPLPSIYPVDGINSAAMFNGTFGDEEGGLATIQSFDSYEFPTGSASYGGWSNGNQTLYPIEYTGGGFFAQKKIYFCASTTEAATVYFRFENEVYPANSQITDTAREELTADGVMRAYALDVPITFAVNSLLFLMLERDTPITMGKVMGNWNGLPTQNITTDTDGDGVVDYCEDFPNDTPEWVDTDGDGASDDADAFSEDATQWEATP